MNQFTNGTSALKDSSACWSLNKMGNRGDMAAYELRARETAGTQASGIMMNVIGGLLGGMHVGVIAECGEHGIHALSGLDNVWHDGRMLKRGEGGAFVALDRCFSELVPEEIEPCVGAGTAFRFLGFDGHVIEDAIFRSLMRRDSDAVIEVSCRDFADGVLSICFDAEKVDETALLGGISECVQSSGRVLQIEM